jgi:hypothetical protein
MRQVAVKALRITISRNFEQYRLRPSGKRNMVDNKAVVPSGIYAMPTRVKERLAKYTSNKPPNRPLIYAQSKL